MMQAQFSDSPFQVQLSFHKIIERLEDTAAQDKGLAGKNAKTLLKKVASHPELKNGITKVSQVEENANLIADLMADLFPASLTKNEIKAIGIPYLGLTFNYTERLREILKAAGKSFDINIRDFDDHQFYVFSCCIILNRLYSTNFDFAKPLFYDILSAEGYIKHYRILYNADFLELTPTENAVKISPNDVDLLMNNYDDLALWKEKFPAGSWIMKGFTIMTLIDVTVENAVSMLKSTLIGAAYEPDMQQKLATIFRSIFRIADLGAGFTAFNSELSKFSQAALGKKFHSFLLPFLHEVACGQLLCEGSYKRIMQDHTYFAVSDVDRLLKDEPDNTLCKHFEAQNIKSFILAPVVKNGILLGVLELVSPRSKELNSVNANKLQNVMPFIVDSIDRRINELQNEVRAVIQENYTTLHPSVYWRFKNEAQNFIHGMHTGQPYTLQEVVFKDVYPLYGQVDIKDSSITRNLSLRDDLLNQLNQLINILEQVSDYQPISAAANNLSDLRGFVNDLLTDVRADTEQQIQHYLETNIYPLIISPGTFNQEQQESINNYFKQLDAVTGNFHINRRKYEETLAQVNARLIEILERRQAEVQTYLPHYFERFKTDGVEHNLYMGTSINQNKKFEPIDLHRLRLWELILAAEMQIMHHHLKLTLPYQLGVASLILVFSAPVSIRFRMDEKHFDIDGAYNIRYEVIKKRIDKAHIKNSRDRITRHGKIVIIYSADEEEEEYLGYIRILQGAGILRNDIEYFNIEDLQGVLGLKGIRVTPVYDQAVPLETTSYDGFYAGLAK
jgi:hypothetical protein